MPEEVDYVDYHRTVIGYHGTTEQAAERLVAGEPFTDSDADDEWFGKGVYFWEHAFQQAWWWADRRSERSDSKPAVVGAILRLGRCFDLLDPPNTQVLLQVHDKLVADLTTAQLPVPKNSRHYKRLDCAVFNYLYNNFEAKGQPIDTARAVYVPSKANRVSTRGAGFMANRTSKSASEIREASSPSGTSSKTDATGGKFGFIVEHIRKRTPEETVQALKRIGVLTEDGELTDHYKQPGMKKSPK